jgi:hypothetical protein
MELLDWPNKCLHILLKQKDYNMKYEERDWCAFFRAVEADPYAIVTPRMTIRDLLLARAHIQTCQECSDSVDRTLENEPPEEPHNIIGFN